MTGDPATGGPIAGDDPKGEPPREGEAHREGEAPAEPLGGATSSRPNPKPRTPNPESRTPPTWQGPAIVALIAWVTILPWCAPDAPGAPGLTLDEPFNVQQGVKLAERLRNFDLSGYAKQTA